VKDYLQNTHGSGLDCDFELYCQPPNSLDMNVNDLCFSASLQELQYLDPTNSLHEIGFASTADAAMAWNGNNGSDNDDTDNDGSDDDKESGVER
jgi:hypothetical protein